MSSLNRLLLVTVPLLLMLAAAACGEDPTPTPLPTAEPTPTSTPVPTPTPTATPTPTPEAADEPAGPRTYVMDTFSIEDGIFVLRTGRPTEGYAPDGVFGWPPGVQVPSVGLPGGIVMNVAVGDTIRFDTIRQSGSRSTVAHRFTVEALGIDINLDDGRYGSDPPGGPAQPWEHTFTEPGDLIITCSLHPDDHGEAKFAVSERSPGA